MDATNSTYELMCTAALLRAGYSHDEAWSTITAAHPGAMVRARGEGRVRWTHSVWNAAAASDDAFAPTPVVDAQVWAATQQARARVREYAWGLPVRQRPSVLVIAEVIWRRMETTGSLRVPVPERDLVLDTTIRDRKTIRGVLRALDAAGVGVLHRECWDITEKAASSFEFEIEAALGGVSEIPPPSFHTPLLSALSGTLTGRNWITLTHLTATAPLSPSQLATLTQSTPTPSAPPAPHVVRSQLECLLALQALGLAECDEQGQWRPGSLTPDQTLQHPDHDAMREQVRAERQGWRSGWCARWQAARTAAVTETHKRYRHWWGGLQPSERAARLRMLSARFDASSVTEQSALKSRLRARDHARGIDVDARRQAWWQAHAPVEQEQRRNERLARWHALPQTEQVAHARAWRSSLN